MTALCALERVAFKDTSAWVRLRVRFMKQYRKQVRELALEEPKSRVTLLDFTQLCTAQTIGVVADGFKTISELVTHDIKTHLAATRIREERMRFFPRFLEDLGTEDDPPPTPTPVNEKDQLDCAELRIISNTFEAIIETAFASAMEGLEDDLRHEVHQLAGVTRFQSIGALSRAVYDTLLPLGGPQEVAKAVLNILGPHVAKLTMPASPILEQLLPAIEGSPASKSTSSSSSS